MIDQEKLDDLSNAYTRFLATHYPKVASIDGADGGKSANSGNDTMTPSFLVSLRVLRRFYDGMTPSCDPKGEGINNLQLYTLNIEKLPSWCHSGVRE